MKKLLIGGLVAGAVLGAGIYGNSQLLEAASANPDARYVMNKTKDGFLRMDTVTGKVSLCHPKSSSWVCEVVADDREVLEKEIARLEDRIGVLKRHAKKSKTSILKLPSDDEIEEVLSFFEKFVKRFKNITEVFDDEKPDDSI